MNHMKKTIYPNPFKKDEGSYPNPFDKDIEIVYPPKEKEPYQDFFEDDDEE